MMKILNFRMKINLVWKLILRELENWKEIRIPFLITNLFALSKGKFQTFEVLRNSEARITI